jgi:hypothetical protein
MTQRSLAWIADHIEFVYGMWERFEITTGTVTDLLKSLVSECCSVKQQSSYIEAQRRLVDGVDGALMACVYDLVCRLRDTWRTHIQEEVEDEDLADVQRVP